MTKDNYLDLFDTKDKAIHHCLWMNFKYRVAKISFGVINGPDDNWAVLEEATAKEMQIPFLDIAKDCSQINFEQISHIRMDEDALLFWEEIAGIFSVADGNILRFILHSKIPLEKLIRYELAARGHDKNTNWVGFEKAKEVWLKN